MSLARQHKVARKDENEHKSAINPNPQIAAPASASSRKRVIITVPEEDEEEPIIIFETENEEEEEEEADPVRGLDEDDEDEEGPVVLDILTPAQESRKNMVYKKGDIVQIEYKVAGQEKEKLGYGVIDQMDEELPHGYRTAQISWIYERTDLLEDNDELQESVLEDMNFEDGDYASSDHMQYVNVYNIVRAHNEMRDLIKFCWDGTNLTPSEGVKPVQELPRNLAIAKEWLLSYKPWTDTRYGGNWWWTINSLLSIGHATSNSSTRTALEGFFLDENKEPIVSTDVTWEPVQATSERCDACGNSRFVTGKWKETGWLVGKTCQARIDALYKTCKYMHAARAKAKENKSGMSQPWLQRVTKRLDELSKTAQLAIAGDHR